MANLQTGGDRQIVALCVAPGLVSLKTYKMTQSVRVIHCKNDGTQGVKATL